MIFLQGSFIFDLFVSLRSPSTHRKWLRLLVGQGSSNMLVRTFPQWHEQRQLDSINLIQRPSNKVRPRAQRLRLTKETKGGTYSYNLKCLSMNRLSLRHGQPSNDQISRRDTQPHSRKCINTKRLSLGHDRLSNNQRGRGGTMSNIELLI